MSEPVAEFAAFPALEMVTIDSLDDVDTVDVDGRLVRLVLRVSREQRAQLDVAGVRARLLERGARHVVDRIVTIRGRATAGLARGRERVGVESVTAWLRESGEEQNVIDRSLELLVELSDS